MGKIKTEPIDGLGNHIYLEKQDKLREIGVDIPTSQIVVVGSQSSGKSSLLESITGFSFPRGQGLCTRYATQITLRRNPVASTVISIIPHSDSDQDRKDVLRAFRNELSDFDGKTLARVIKKANKVMGIRSGATEDDTALPMFSDDILKIEISGPEKPHLTVIDVPGLFQVTDEGITTDADRTKVENMVRRYMENERTIVLAVLSCLSDRATEGVLQFAKTADPEGVRTVGVLTKADLVTEQAVVQTLLQLVKGNTLKLGYFIVRNRGADEDTLSIADCQMKEKEKFAEPLWAELTKLGRTGVQALRAELQGLLMELARRELPKQRAEVEQRLSDCHKKRESMGPPRDGPASQRECLVKLAARFERIVRDALDGRYDGNPIFSAKPELKLATKIMNLNEGFTDLVWKKGHTWEFMTESRKDGVDTLLEYEKTSDAVLASTASIPELQQVICDNTPCTAPLNEAIMDQIEKYYKESRGPELGTFGGALLALTFRAQTSKWRAIVMTHVETVIVVAHHFIKTVLLETIADERIREELWGLVLLERLQAAYSRAKVHAQFLLDIEVHGRPRTYNHYFSDNVLKSKAERLTQAFIGKSDDRGSDYFGIYKSTIGQMVADKSNSDQTKEDVHDILESYYKVSRKRFVDVICQQAIDHFLLDGNGSPLKVLNPELVSNMSDTQLDMIAGEDGNTKRERERLNLEIQGLEAAMQVMKG